MVEIKTLADLSVASVYKRPRQSRCSVNKRDRDSCSRMFETETETRKICIFETETETETRKMVETKTETETLADLIVAFIYKRTVFKVRDQD